MNTQPNVDKIICRDLAEDAAAPLPGQFALEIQFKPDAEKTGADWEASVFEDERSEDFFTGQGQGFTFSESEPPTATVRVADIGSRGIQERIQADEHMDLVTLGSLNEMHQDQLLLMRELRISSYPAALTAKFLATLIAKEEITPDFAEATLSENFRLGANASEQLVRAAISYLEKGALTPAG